MTHSEKQQHQQMQRAAGALGGKTTRACDGCARRRARWYCGADDAFLCQACDASVHSANPLARRHERLRLKTSSPSVLRLDAAHAAGPTWHHGIIRKARTRRPKPAVAAAKSEPLVPDLETASADENNPEEEQLLYRVPIFDPVLAEFCSPPPTAEDAEGQKQMAQQLDYNNYADGSNCEGLVSFLPADDADLAEFAADMETLLGRGIEDGAFCMEGLGLNEAKAESGVGDASKDCNKLVKMEANDDSYQMDAEFDAPRETLELNFDCGSPAPIGDDDKDEQMASAARRVALRLDYEAVITAWSSSCQGSSPWTDGERPQINPDVCWPDYMVGQWGGGEGSYAGSLTGHTAVGGDGGREARVTRYREKRRTRLFAKKIRYEVRKLNAEKRPRMKGRFVKRSSFPPAAPVTGVPSFPY